MSNKFRLLCLIISIPNSFILQASSAVETKTNKFVYMTSLYNETNINRTKEYIQCLEINLANKSFAVFHVLYDTTNDHLSKDLTILNFLKSKGITITYIKGRPTYGYCFSLANEFYPSQKIILSNADIYFNDTLKLLENYDFTNKLLALTRWQVKTDKTIVPFLKNNRPALDSQDTWIFATPFPVIEQYNIQMGSMHGDNLLSYYAKKSALTVLNPCMSIQCCHLHLSGIRNYNRAVAVPKVLHGYKYTPWQKLMG